MTELSTERATPRDDDVAPVPVSGPERASYVDAQLERSRLARGEGERAAAVEIIVAALRAGLWRYGRLWTELLSLMDEPADYQRLRSLWLESSTACHNSVATLRTIARGASAAGEHDEARMLLRRACLLQARRIRRLRSRLGRAKHNLVTRTVNWRSPSMTGFDQRAAAALLDLNRELDDLGVRAFLISGTLLGYVRESAFISWDKDIDVGVFTDEIQPAELQKAFDRATAFEVRRLDFNSERLRVNHTNGVMIDIFPHYQDGDGRIWHDGTATRWWNSPFELTTVDFLRVSQFVPDPPERYLDENYGDWRVPNPDFDARLDTPNVEVTDPDYFETLLLFSLLDALVKNKPRRRDRYRELLRERGEGDWLNRL